MVRVVRWAIAALWVVAIAGGGSFASAQEPVEKPPAAGSTPPQEPEKPAATESKPPQEGEPPPPPKEKPPEEEHRPGSPKDASAGGSERRLPDHAGLFPWGPLSLIEPPITAAQDWLSENARLDVGLRALLGFQQASGGPGERTAAAQDYRMYGTFHAFNWRPEDKGCAGNVYFRLEYRNELFTDITPAELNTEIGTLFDTTYGQDEHDFALVQLYYEQFLADGGLRLRVGKIDPDDYFNLGRWADDYRYFNNTLFSAFPTANHPSGGLGANAQWYINKEWTLTGGLSDVQGRKTETGFTTVDELKFFYGVDLTFSPKIEGLGQGNYRVGLEYRDAVEDKGRPSDTTIYVNIDQEIAKDIAPFLRFGHGTGNSTGVQYHGSIGIGVDNCFDRPGDAAGIGFGFDTPDEDIDSKRDIEWALELFYRFQLTRKMQLMVGGQGIFDPINDNGRNSLAIFEARLVIDF